MISDAKSLLEVFFEADSQYRSHYKKFAGAEETTLSGSASEFSHYLGDRLKAGAYPSARKVFQAVESLLEESASSSEVKDVLCTCFLENLVNRFTESPEVLARFVPLLGERSKAYCKAWDEFTGVKTPGLYD